MARFGQKLESFRSRERRLLAAVAVSALAAMLAGVPILEAQQQRQHPRHKEDLKHQVEKLEESWRVAQLNDDVDTMDKLLSDDYVGITMNGQVVTKMQQLDRMRTRTLSLTKIDLDDMKVKLTGPTAVVTGRTEVDGTNDGEPMHGTYRYMRVYMRTSSGAWKITNFEVTRVGEPGAGRRVRGLEPPPGTDGAASPTTQKLVAGNSAAR